VVTLAIILVAAVVLACVIRGKRRARQEEEWAEAERLQQEARHGCRARHAERQQRHP
jgi:hypothetical protein